MEGGFGFSDVFALGEMARRVPRQPLDRQVHPTRGGRADSVRCCTVCSMYSCGVLPCRRRDSDRAGGPRHADRGVARGVVAQPGHRLPRVHAAESDGSGARSGPFCGGGWRSGWWWSSWRWCSPLCSPTPNCPWRSSARARRPTWWVPACCFGARPRAVAGVGAGSRRRGQRHLLGVGPTGVPRARHLDRPGGHPGTGGRARHGVHQEDIAVARSVVVGRRDPAGRAIGLVRAGRGRVADLSHRRRCPRARRRQHRCPARRSFDLAEHGCGGGELALVPAPHPATVAGQETSEGSPSRPARCRWSRCCSTRWPRWH